MESRGDDPSVSMWIQAGEKEWSGIVGRNCFLHDLTKADLVRRGVLPKKRIVVIIIVIIVAVSHSVKSRIPLSLSLNIP